MCNGRFSYLGVVVTILTTCGADSVYTPPPPPPPDLSISTTPPDLIIPTIPPPDLSIPTTPPDLSISTTPPPDLSILTTPPDLSIATIPPPDLSILTTPPNLSISTIPPPDLSIATIPPPDLSIETIPPPDLSILTTPPDLSIATIPPPDLSILTTPPNLSIATIPPPDLSIPRIPPLPPPFCPLHCRCTTNDEPDDNTDYSDDYPDDADHYSIPTYISNYNCTVSNTTFTLNRYAHLNWGMICEESQWAVNCSELPRVSPGGGGAMRLWLGSCPLGALLCFGRVSPAATVDELSLTGLSEPLTEPHAALLRHVTDLDISLTDEVTKFPLDVNSALPQLKKLQLSSGNLQLSPHDLHGTDLHELFFYYNNLTVLPAGLFNGSSHLKLLVVKGNHYFDKIYDDTFLGLDSLEDLSLEFNDIRSIEAGALASTPKLREVNMYANKLSSLPDGLFDGLGALTKIFVQDNGDVELSLGSRLFAHLPSLTSVTVRYCGVTSLSDHLFKRSVNITEISMYKNNISVLPAKVFSDLSKLIELDLSFNKIESLPEGIFANLKALNKLALGNNQISTLSDSVVTGLTNLNWLSLNDNHLTLVYQVGYYWSGAFYDRKTSEQLFEDAHSKATEITSGFKLQSLPQLVKLDLSGNHISALYNGWSSKKQNLFLDLSRNSFSDIKDFNVNFSNSGNMIIDLEYNNITDMTLDPRVAPSNDSLRTIQSHLVLTHNPITCDCNILGLYRRAKGFRLRGTDTEPIFHLEGLTCHSPPSLAGQLLTDVSPDRLVCDLPDHCPDNCTCTYRAVANELIYDCLNMPLINETKHEDLPLNIFEEPRVTLNLKYQPESIRELNVHTLNLSNTGLDNLIFTRTKSLKILDVSHNKLTSIPSEFLNNDIKLYISNNSLECECELIKALKRKGLVADLEDVKCTNGVEITKLDISELCKGAMAFYARICIGAVTSLFLLIIVKTIYTHLHDIRSFISRNILCQRGDANMKRTEMRLDATKQFDLFISYAHQDEEFVSGRLLPTLENKYKQKVCVHSRDWIVGDMTTDQIINSVDCSRRTLIILTENFLVSEWSYLEFRTAHNLSIREGRPRVIIILLDEAIARDERLGADLKSYIAVNTYLVWGDPHFWERLKKILPGPRRK